MTGPSRAVPDPRTMLSAAALRVTRQRQAIVEALERSARPVTAQALHAALSRGGSGPGLATVYRTLQALEEAGYARTFPAGDGELSYKLCDPGHHHHLICERCGAVVEIPSCEIEGWANQAARRRGFTVSSHQADIFGTCSTCGARGSERSDRRAGRVRA
ncbi:MAG: Fur family transcriptional regulator [Candidatus Velamenicoccus archaeovorus]